MKQSTKTSRKPAAKARSSSTKRKSATRSKATPKTLSHHARRIYHGTPRFIHGMVAGAFVGIVLVASLGVVRGADALTINAPNDCDDYAVIRCGVASTNDLQKKYNNVAGVAAIYRNFGISASDISNIDKNVVSGDVHDNGKVTVKGVVVATDAITAARLFVTGSHKVTEGNTTFFVRHVTSEFARTVAPAYVVMNGDKFVYAILATCGNPIIATDVPSPPTHPTPPPVKHPTPKPPKTPTPKPPKTTTPPPTTVVETASTTLPNTGPGEIVMVAILAIAGGYIFHIRHNHKLRRAAHAAHHTTHHTAHPVHHPHKGRGAKKLHRSYRRRS